ncbi:meiotic recombination protein SPO11 [Mucor ambiguus]|uniref:DNA topoisomerase (ATP-hydrolyzing) n=1 Tax=Mucor ambiguus TaxID=91626 RepID=A0A0C9LVM2_9FUNG|nr:meiotic recombination protein SPO11 [Mucor ambiguus]
MVQFIEIYDNEDEDELYLSDFNNVPDILDHEPSMGSSNSMMPSSSTVPPSPAPMHRSDYTAVSSAITTTSTTASSSHFSLSSTVEKSRETLMSEIEDTIEQMFASISMGELCKLPMTSRPLPQRKRKRPISANGPADTTPNAAITTNGPSASTDDDTTRYLSLSSSCNKTRALARYLSVLQMIYEAVAYKIMLTKRDMYYRNVELFGKQSVVDVSAASKGLVFGPIIIKLKNNKILNCSTSNDTADTDDEQGILIPPIHQVVQVQCKAKCMIVVEKEATFRYLVSIGFCQSLPESCVLVTGKGYPDLSTRQFVKYFSTHFTTKPILALMDGDPHGLDIYATYKWGTRAMAFDVFNLAVNSIELIGLTCQDRQEFHISSQCLIPLSERDRAKCQTMVRTYDQDETPGQSQLIERGWWQDINSELASQGHQSYIKEINQLLASDYKCELQALNHNGPYHLTKYLIKKLAKYI